MPGLDGYLLVPVLIFAAELCVVTLSTIRTIFVSRGKRWLAPALGFFEVSIWLFAIGQIMQNLSNLACYLAFAAGFTLGNFLGIFIEAKLALGNLLVRIVTNRDAEELIDKLKQARYGVTSLTGEGATGPVRVILTVIQRRELVHVVAIIEGFDAKAFYSVDDLHAANQGVFPVSNGQGRRPAFRFFPRQAAAQQTVIKGPTVPGETVALGATAAAQR